jgi:hypothetical protein
MIPPPPQHTQEGEGTSVGADSPCPLQKMSLDFKEAKACIQDIFVLSASIQGLLKLEFVGTSFYMDWLLITY